MSCGRRCAHTAVFLLSLMTILSPTHAVDAGTYTWTDIVGTGTFTPYPGAAPIPFEASGVTLTEIYSGVAGDKFTGIWFPDQGYGILGGEFVPLLITPTYAAFEAFGQLDFGWFNDEVIVVTLYGAPEPLDPGGFPISLDNYANSRIVVNVAPVGSGGLEFRGATLPEPAGAVMLAMGVVGLGTAYAIRCIADRGGMESPARSPVAAGSGLRPRRPPSSTDGRRRPSRSDCR